VIASLRGTVLSRAGSWVVLDVHGVGYGVQVSDRLALTLHEGEDTLLHIATIVREDSISLFGFGTSEDLGLFDLLRSVTGVGPKSALSILSALSADEIHDAVVGEKDGVFRQVSGIGPKTAKLITLSLQGAFDSRPRSAAQPPQDHVSEVVKQSVVQALVGLGWSDKIARQGVAQAVEENPEASVDTQSLLRNALTILGPHTNREARS
jgi:Holliday junction DNA helicase RuvA